MLHGTSDIKITAYATLEWIQLAPNLDPMGDFKNFAFHKTREAFAQLGRLQIPHESLSKIQAAIGQLCYVS